MRKIFCDACGVEIEKEIKEFNVLCHIAENSLVNSGYVIQMNNKWVSTSGRQVHKDLCLECYNRIYGVAWNEFMKKTMLIIQ